MANERVDCTSDVRVGVGFRYRHDDVLIIADAHRAGDEFPGDRLRVIEAYADPERLHETCRSPDDAVEPVRASRRDVAGEQSVRRGYVRQRGVISGAVPGRIDQAALGVICSCGTSSIWGVASAVIPSSCM